VKPARNQDLHGAAPDNAPVALLLIDVINDMEFEGGEALFAQALPMAEHLADFKQRAKAAGIPAIYTNDNFGRWKSDFATLVRHCTDNPVRGRPIAQLLAPEPDDYFVLKPKHSAFFATPLDTLLKYLGASTVILTGLTGDMCVLFTAAEAFMRDLHVMVAEDCVASIDREENARALDYMVRVMDAEVRRAAAIDLAGLCKRR
jgi:nicotinamidase-related amidase